MLKQLKKALSLALAAAMCLSLLPASALAVSGSVAIDKTNFPDPTFRAYLLEKVDTDDNSLLSPTELEGVTYINVDGSSTIDNEKITTLEGIHLFPNLTTLDCDNNKLTALDLTDCSKLDYLTCNGNQLTSLKVNGLTCLSTLQCFNNRLTSLSLRGCSDLYSLSCNNNRLSFLDLTGCTGLTRLKCRNNLLTSLGLRSCTALSELDCSGNRLDLLDLAYCDELTQLDCSYNRLAALELTNCTKLTKLNCTDNRRIIQAGAPLSELPGFHIAKVKSVQGGNFYNDRVNFTQDILTYTYSCGGHTADFSLIRLTSDVTISEATFPDPNFRAYVETLPGAEDGVFTSEELSKITRIHIDGESLPDAEKMKNMDGVQYFTSLTDLYCDHHLLSSLDLSNCTELTSLSCSYNQLTALDLSHCTKLTTMTIFGNRGVMSSMNFTGCSKLTTLDVIESPMLSLDLTGCSKLTEMRCVKNQLTSLDLSSCSSLSRLNCNDNQLTYLDLKRCPELGILFCENNHLASMDLSNSTKLAKLHCSNNNLTALDLTNCTSLMELYCMENRLTCLDLSHCSTDLGTRLARNSRIVDNHAPLSELVGFDKTKVLAVKGGTFENDRIDFDGKAPIYYTYDCSYPWEGMDAHVDFVLYRSDVVYSTATVTFNVVNGTWADYGNDFPKTTTVLLCDGKGTLTPDQIPTNMVPNKAGQKGRWDKVPNEVTGDVTFTYTFGGEPVSFSDVAPVDYFYQPVQWAVANNVTAGIGNGQFGPNLECTRAQIVTFLWNAHGKPEPEATVSPFSDVPEDEWYFKPIMWAVENKITSGIGGGKFGPDLTCTRAQAMTFLWKDEGKPTVEGDMNFSDVPKNEWFYEPVKWAVENKITSGVGSGRFGSEDDCLRAQIVTFMHRASK